MPARVNFDVEVSGPFFRKDHRQAAGRAIGQELLKPITERMLRPPTRRSRLGVARNRIRDFVRDGGLEAEYSSTLVQPRTTGTAWTRYSIFKVFRPIIARKSRKAGQAFAEELGGR